MSDANLIRSMRQISKRMVQTHYRHPWQWRIEMDEAPDGFDLFVKELSQDRFSVDVNAFKAGAIPISIPEGIQPVTLTLTCYDSEDERMYRWFESRMNKMVNPDGTWNLPKEYLLTCKIYRRYMDGREELRQQHKMLPLTLGSLSESVDNHENVEFPMSFIEFRAGSIDY